MLLLCVIEDMDFVGSSVEKKDYNSVKRSSALWVFILIFAVDYLTWIICGCSKMIWLGDSGALQLSGNLSHSDLYLCHANLKIILI